jgi:biotin transport system substrate-specific component
MPAEAATLRVAVLPRTGILGDVLLVCAGTALVALAAQVSIPLGFTPVPITGQTFAVLLVGASLGSLLGIASLTLYMGAGLFLPIYTNQGSGWDVLSGPTGGYIVGFIFAAGVAGVLAERPHWDRRFPTAVAAMLTGSVIIYAFGLVWLQHTIHTNVVGTLELGLYPFILGDLVKLYLAAALLPAAWLGIKRFRGERDAD